MKYSGVFHLGVHKATLAKAGVEPGARVDMTIQLDDEPLPTDVVPDDLAKRLKKDKGAAAAWQALRPSLKREHVKHLIEAKRAETRTRRLEQILAGLMRTEHD